MKCLFWFCLVVAILGFATSPPAWPDRWAGARLLPLLLHALGTGAAASGAFVCQLARRINKD